MTIGGWDVAETTVRPGLCHRCDRERPIHQTVPWQANICSHCASTDVEILN
jgi:NMD protein affecting ribosome stability and mRNA decay